MKMFIWPKQNYTEYHKLLYLTFSIFICQKHKSTSVVYFSHRHKHTHKYAFTHLNTLSLTHMRKSIKCMKLNKILQLCSIHTEIFKRNVRERVYLQPFVPLLIRKKTLLSVMQRSNYQGLAERGGVAAHSFLCFEKCDILQLCHTFQCTKHKTQKDTRVAGLQLQEQSLKSPDYQETHGWYCPLQYSECLSKAWKNIDVHMALPAQNSAFASVNRVG